MSAALLLLGPLERALPLLSESLHDGEAMREGSMVGTAGAPGIGEEWGATCLEAWEQVVGTPWA